MKDTEVAAIAQLQATPAILQGMIAGVPEELATMPLDREWSIKQWLAHYIDVERSGFRDRLKRMVEEDSPEFTSIDAMATLEASGWESWQIPKMLDEFACLRGETIDWLRTLSEEQLARTGKHDTAGEVTVSNVIHYWPTHDMAHIRHIQRMLGSIFLHEMGGAKEWDV